MDAENRLEILDKLYDTVNAAPEKGEANLVFTRDECAILVALYEDQHAVQVSLHMLVYYAERLKTVEDEASQFASSFLLDIVKNIKGRGKAVFIENDSRANNFLYLMQRGIGMEVGTVFEDED